MDQPDVRTRLCQVADESGAPVENISNMCSVIELCDDKTRRELANADKVSARVNKALPNRCACVLKLSLLDKGEYSIRATTKNGECGTEGFKVTTEGMREGCSVDCFVGTEPVTILGSRSHVVKTFVPIIKLLQAAGLKDMFIPLKNYGVENVTLGIAIYKPERSAWLMEFQLISSSHRRFTLYSSKPVNNNWATVVARHILGDTNNPQMDIFMNTYFDELQHGFKVRARVDKESPWISGALTAYQPFEIYHVQANQTEMLERAKRISAVKDEIPTAWRQLSDALDARNLRQSRAMPPRHPLDPR